jgi:hypothetical protein
MSQFAENIFLKILILFLILAVSVPGGPCNAGVDGDKALRRFQQVVVHDISAQIVYLDIHQAPPPALPD